MSSIPRLFSYLICFTLLPNCTMMGTNPSRPTGIPAGVDQVLTGKDNVQDNPSAYLDKTVLASGEIEQILTSNAFRLDYGGGIMGVGDKEILVLLKTPPTGGDVVLGTNTEVIGSVQLFNLLQAERELGMNLNDDLFEEYQNKPVIIAQTALKRP